MKTLNILKCFLLLPLIPPGNLHKFSRSTFHHPRQVRRYVRELFAFFTRKCFLPRLFRSSKARELVALSSNQAQTIEFQIPNSGVMGDMKDALSSGVKVEAGPLERGGSFEARQSSL